jgi:predicted anti-sigma-YlaC factor YlaD
VRDFVTEHLSTQLLERYRRRKLAPAESLALDDHLAACETCRDKLQEGISARATLLALQSNLHIEPSVASDHPPREQLSAYVDGWLDKVDRELIESHFGFCQPCGAQIEELRAYAERRAEAPARASVSSAATVAQPGFLAKMFDLRFSSAFRFAGATAVTLIILALALWLLSRTGKQGDVVVTPSPVPSPTSISPSPEATAPTLLALNDGAGRVTLDAQGNLTGLESLSPTDQQRIKTALTTQRVETPRTLRELKSTSGDVMGSPTDASFALLSPVGKIVASNRPTLRWQPLRGAINYQVTITDPRANYKEVAVSPALSDAKWTVDHPLKRGRVYTWQVTAGAESGEIKAPALNAPEAKFRVLGQAKADELTRARKAYAGRHLTLGLLYAQAGLLDEAEREFQVLVKANPESDVAKNLLRDVRAKRHAR